MIQKKSKHRQCVFLAGAMFCLMLSHGSARGSAPGDAAGDPLPQIVPTGVDSALAGECASAAETLFVSIEREQAAEELFSEARALLETAAAMHRCIAKIDSDKTSDEIIAEKGGLDLPLTFKVKFKQKVTHEGIQEGRRWIREEMESYERSAEIKLRESRGENPFHPGAGVELAKLSLRRARRDPAHPKREEYLTSAMEEVNRLLLLDQSNHYLVSLKGEVEVERQDWESAKHSFQRAVNLVFDYAFLPSDLSGLNEKTSVDSAVVFKYLLFLIQAHVKLYESDQALVQIRKAEPFARHAEGRKILDNYREMIHWADGDIRSRELFVEAAALEDQKHFSECVKNYHEILNRMDSKFSDAFIETSYRLSLIEYQHFKDDPSYLDKYGVHNTGMGRLRNIIRHLDQDSYGAPRDSLARSTFEVFGTMLFNEGIDAVENHYHALAMGYFMQGALFQSSFQAKSSLELAKLVMHHGDIGFRWALHAYSQIDEMTREETQQLYQLLRFVTMRTNQPDLCHFFHNAFRVFLHPDDAYLNRKVCLMGYEFLRSGYVDLKQYCENTFDIPYDPSSIHVYEQKYMEEEAALPGPMKRQIRKLIEEAYQKQNREDAIQSWRSFIDRIPL